MMCIFFRDDDWNVDEARALEKVLEITRRALLFRITFRLNNAGAPNRKTLSPGSKKRPRPNSSLIVAATSPAFCCVKEKRFIFLYLGRVIHDDVPSSVAIRKFFL